MSTELDTATLPAAYPRKRMDPAERRARNRARAGYIRNALEPTSAAWADDMTVAELKSAAQRWTDDQWEDYLDA